MQVRTDLCACMFNWQRNGIQNYYPMNRQEEKCCHDWRLWARLCLKTRNGWHNIDYIISKTTKTLHRQPKPMPECWDDGKLLKTGIAACSSGTVYCWHALKPILGAIHRWRLLYKMRLWFCSWGDVYSNKMFSMWQRVYQCSLCDCSQQRVLVFVNDDPIELCTLMFLV